jgi:hypothetical protein
MSLPSQLKQLFPLLLVGVAWLSVPLLDWFIGYRDPHDDPTKAQLLMSWFLIASACILCIYACFLAVRSVRRDLSAVWTIASFVVAGWYFWAWGSILIQSLALHVPRLVA